MFWSVFLVMLHWTAVHAIDTLLIGVIFPASYGPEEIAFQLAVDQVNNDPTVLPNHKIEYVRNATDILSTFDSFQKVCYQLNEGVTAIIGPLSSTSVKAAYPMCQGFHVPMIAPSASDPSLGSRQFYKYLLRMMPSDAVQSAALVDLIGYYRWDTLAILTDNTDYGINGVIELQTKASENLWRVLSVQQFSATSNISATDARQQLKNIKGTGAHVVILNCLASYAVHVLEQANHLGMMQAGWAWIVTDGITGFNDLPKLVQKRPYLKGIVGARPASFSGAMHEEFNQIIHETTNGTSLQFDMPYYPTWPMAYYDAVLVYAEAMHHLIEVDAYIIRTERHNCGEVPARVWRQGKVVYRELTRVATDGVMRDLEFNEDGSPLNGAYDIVSLGEYGWIQHGSWSENDGLSLDVSSIHSVGGTLLHDVRDYVGDLVNKTLNVVTVVDPPFVFKLSPDEERDDAVCGPEDCFYGYSIDLLVQLAADLKFTFVIREVPEKKYGRRNEMSNTWNGLIGMLIRDEDGVTMADMGVGAISISSERQSVISFTKPYRDLQMGILIGSGEETFNPWSFLSPLSYDLWGFTIGTAFVVGILITCVDKVSPFGHHGTKAQIDGEFEHEAMDTNDDGTVDYWEMRDWYNEKSTMSLHNAILWSMASLFQQGGERHPKSWSARVAAGAWWFGVLIITSSYTANLAAFLTIKDSADEISSVEDLASRVSMKYGTVRDTDVQELFDTATRDPYIKMAGKMRTWGLYFDTTEEAIEHTINASGSFAFLYDLPAATYWKGQDCRLKVVKNGFANFGYGFALSKDSIYAEEITINIYLLRESGYMDALDNKWITKTAVCAEDTGTDIGSDTVTIDMPSLWGVFWIIYVGFGISFALAIIEWVVSAITAVRTDESQAPKTISESLRRRFRILLKDFMENWFFNFHRKEMKKQEQALRPISATVRAAAMLKMRAARLRHARNSIVVGSDVDKLRVVMPDDAKHMTPPKADQVEMISKFDGPSDDSTTDILSITDGRLNGAASIVQEDNYIVANI